ncbi:MAG: hypothetical protein JWM07_787 [Candidatus Saccharibacteria bacterium]|nr:hypothetical protein [Candidatus Saccharibacteria bacterium]
MKKIETGKYQHYKGNIYEVIGVGKDTETENEVVIYQPLYDNDVAYWVRPLAMFCDTVVIDGESVPRFKKVDDNQ